MRFFDSLYIAIKNIKGKWAVLIAFGIAISVFCLCSAGTVLFTVGQEKSMPFELVASTENGAGVTDTTIAKILEIEDEENATPVIQIPTQITMGEYSAELTLTGIAPSYLSSQSVLPENSVMPYIVLNEAACRLFSKGDKTPANGEMPEISWLNKKATISMGEESAPITSKVVTVLSSEKNDEPVAYISLNAAKELLRSSGQPTVYQQAYVRIRNIGCAESLNAKIVSLGLAAVNADAELQAKWDLWSKEMAYLFVMGAFGLICSGALLFAWRSVDIAKQQEAYEILHWLGVKKSTVASLFVLQAVMVILIGVCAGILFRVMLPSFLPQELKGVSVFML